MYVGTKDWNVRLSRTPHNQERKNRGLMMKKILVLLLLTTYNWYRDGTDTVPVPAPTTQKMTVPIMTVPIMMIPVLGINSRFCTGTDEEMRDLGREPARTMTPEEEEELLNYSEEEGTGTQTGDGEDEEMPDEDSEEAHQRREKEAEESDRLAKLAEIQERIRRRKAEKERIIMEQKKRRMSYGRLSRTGSAQMWIRAV